MANGAEDGEKMYKAATTESGVTYQGTDGKDVAINPSDTTFGNISTGKGDDQVATRWWNSTVNLGEGNDIAVSGDAGDFIYGGPGDDVLTGKGHEPSANPTNQIDELHGQAGNDTLVNDGGYVRMTGGTGADDFVVNAQAHAARGGASGTTITDFNPSEGDTIKVTELGEAEARKLAAAINANDQAGLQELNIKVGGSVSDVSAQTVGSGNSTTVEIGG